MTANIADTFTSTGAKFFHHQEAMYGLQAGRGRPITTHIMLTDVCNHTCAFCSVQARAGDSLPFDTVIGYLDILCKHGLRSVILSGGGNPILYKDRATGRDINDVVYACHVRGLEIGLITNGMPMNEQAHNPYGGVSLGRLKETKFKIRRSWKMVTPNTLDYLTWVRISMSGLDHPENEVYVPDIDRSKTALGFSYVAHDIYNEPKDPHHGKVSRKLDLISEPHDRKPDLRFEDRVVYLTTQFVGYIKKYQPRYLRLLPNCLEPEKITERCGILTEMAARINFMVDREVAFVQYKPPAAPKACYLGYIHPVLNCDGYVYPCDSCVLNESANHQFANPWRICHWKDVGEVLYNRRVRSLIDDPAVTCPGCVFTRSNEILTGVVQKTITLRPSPEKPEHVNFV